MSETGNADVAGPAVHVEEMARVLLVLLTRGKDIGILRNMEHCVVHLQSKPILSGESIPVERQSMHTAYTFRMLSRVSLSHQVVVS